MDRDHRLFPYMRWIETALILQGLAESDKLAIAEKANIQSRTNNEFFFMQEDPAQKAYLLIEGQVRLSQLSIDGQQVMLGYIGPGREFGIVAGIHATQYPVTAQAVGNSQALSWDKHIFASFFQTYPQIQQNAMRIMARQIGEFQTRIRELSTQRVEQRIARTLLRLVRHSGKKTTTGVLINLPLTRQDLAELSGTTLFTVSRTLKKWENNGWILSKREQVILLEPHSLVSLAEDFTQDEP